MPSSLYARYLEEATNDGIIETQEGFATYRFINDESIYLVDLYVIPEARKKGNFTFELIDKVIEIGKVHGCKYLYGTVNPKNKMANEILKANLACGMKMDTEQVGIILKKEI